MVLLVIWFIVTATSNGANLTDGADGLLAGASAMIFGAYTIVNVWQNNQLCGSSRPTVVESQCYQVRDPLDLAVFSAAIAAACIGFLWWNAKPARIIMGDVGSLAIGGALAGLAIMSRTELLMAVIAGLFVLETMSVLLQMSYFKLTRRLTGTGRRIFRIAPIHHHFEHLGWDEVTVVIRFWIIAGICVATGLGIFYAVVAHLGREFLPVTCRIRSDGVRSTGGRRMAVGMTERRGVMRKLVYGMNLSLDGYVAAPGDDIGWGVPSDELFQWWLDQELAIGLLMYGRKLWEMMSSHWPTGDQQPDATPAQIEFARNWRDTPKVVFSSTIDKVDWNTRLVTGDAVAEITRLKADDGEPMRVGGATLAGAAMRAGLIDEYEIVTHPVLVGGGRPFFTALDSWVNLNLMETRTFPGGVTLARYETSR